MPIPFDQFLTDEQIAIQELANEFAAKYFEGGGHRNAAGGQSTETLEQTVSKFKASIQHYKEELQAI